MEYFYQKRNRNLEESLDRLSERILENGSGHYETREDFKTGDSDIRAMEEALEQIGQGMKAVPMAEADVASQMCIRDRSYTALVIRLRDMGLFEYHNILEYISNELNLGGVSQ